MRIEDPDAGSIPFEPWPHIIERAEAWERGDHEVILKARQLGLSWLLAAYAVKVAKRPGSHVIIISQGQRESYKLLEKCKYINAHHADGPAPLLKESESEIQFRGGGTITALPSTKNAGRGTSAAALVIVDEAAFHPWAAANYKAYYPAMRDRGQLIVVSTANGASGFFHSLFKGAEARNLKPVFVPWHARPDRQLGDVALRRDVPSSVWLAESQAGFDGMPGTFTQEYPETADEAFVAHSGLVYGVDSDGVRIFHPEQNVKPAPFRWQDAKWRLFAVDPGGRDPTAIVPIGIANDERMHQFGEWCQPGTPSPQVIAEWLQQFHAVAPFDLGWADGEPMVGALRDYGFNVFPAIKDKALGVARTAMVLKSRRLTMGPGCTQSIHQFQSYYFKVRPEGSTSDVAFETTTPAEHHADIPDCVRYIVMGTFEGMPRTVRAPRPVVIR